MRSNDNSVGFGTLKVFYQGKEVYQYISAAFGSTKAGRVVIAYSDRQSGQDIAGRKQL